MFQTVFSIEDLSRITGLTRRTIRYYIQQGRLAHPVGERRAAHYLASHLETLLRIRRLADEGFSLEAISDNFTYSIEYEIENVTNEDIDRIANILNVNENTTLSEYLG